MLNVREYQPSEPIEQFPILEPAAYYGLAGDIVRTIEPHTEAHPAGILASLLTAIGIALGNSVHWRIGGAEHTLRLNIVLVGATAKGRKGTSWSSVKPVLEYGFGPDFMRQNVTTGLSSGEGLIYAVRDETTAVERDKKTNTLETVVKDPGIKDKRMVIIESEFGRVLKAMNREGNTLSAVIRQAWDMGYHDVLRVMTKNSTTATGAHVAIIGHVTRDELLRYLEDTETANGFANRFLWLMVQRARILPFGSLPDERDLIHLGNRLGKVTKWLCNSPNPVLEFDDSARQLWATLYPKLSQEEDGLAAAVLSRAEPYVLRLAGLFAVLDMSLMVKAEHFIPAVALWEYCDSSVRGIFGTQTGDTVADTILKALKEQGRLSKTDVSNLFNRHIKAHRINTAIDMLSAAGKIQSVQDNSCNGRPRVMLEAC
jgi:hypothetical protein